MSLDKYNYNCSLQHEQGAICEKTTFKEQENE